MDGINRKPVQDVLVPQNELVKRASLTPEPSEVVNSNRKSDRIEGNPFFSKNPVEEGASTQKKSSFLGVMWLAVVLVLLVAAFFAMNYFASATVEITPSLWRAHVEQNLVAMKDAVDSELGLQSMVFKDERSQKVEATIAKKIQKKASGKVVIFNTYGKESQRLIKNTRLESPDHKIYRINDSVVVPGAKIVNGKVSEPGSVEAVIYADAAGKEYNIEANDLARSDFTIPGFRGDPRYTKFYAKRKPDVAIEGGFSGAVKVPSDEVVLAAQAKLKEELKTSVVEKARGDLSAKNVTFFPGSMVVKFEEVPQDLNAGDVTQTTMRAVVTVYFFDTRVITDKIARGALPDYRGTSLVVDNMSQLKFTTLDPVESVVPGDLTTLHFTLTGDAVFRGEIDSEKIKAALAGKKKDDFAGIIDKQDNVAKADAVIRPLWNTSFPINTQKISVKILDVQPH